jgi:hypothetical protein
MPHYHQHMLLLRGISELLEASRENGYSSTLRKIRAHTNIRGNDLVDATAKLAVTSFDTLPIAQTFRADVGTIAPCPPFWVMYNIKPNTPCPAFAPGPTQPNLVRPSWRTILEGDRLQMLVFTRPSQQLRQKVITATLRSLHHTSLYKRLVLHSKDNGACIPYF